VVIVRGQVDDGSRAYVVGDATSADFQADDTILEEMVVQISPQLTLPHHHDEV